MNHVNRKNTGFTLIELMLAMGFISALLLAIAFTVIQVGRLYNQGMTLKEINSSSRDVAKDIQSTVGATSAFSITADYVTLPINSGTPSGGRLCLGTYSYIWNYGRVKGTSANGITRYSAIPGNANKPNEWINIVKVADAAKIYCARATATTLQYPNLTAADSAAVQTQELLKSGDHELAIHQFALTSDDTTLRDTLTAQQLYNLDLTVGTNKFLLDAGGGRHSTLDAAQTSCLPPSDPYSDPNYCSVQTFSIVLRAGNRFN